MKIINLLKACAVVAPIVGSVSIVTSCNLFKKEEYITPAIHYDATQVTVTCSPIQLNKSFTITAIPNGGYVVSSVVVTINSKAVTTSQSGNSWTVDGSVVTNNLIVITVTCESDPEAEEAVEYIQDRTFGIAGFNGTGGTICGTGWILSDATKSDTTDYQYWMATNWHVKYGIDEGTSSTRLGYWTSDFASTNYQPFNSFEWYSNKNQFCYTSGDTKTAIDLYVVKVNFGSSSQIPTKIKTRLDKLNQKQASKGCINDFAESTSSQHYTSSKMYCGGYPVRPVTGSGHQSWRFESLKSNFTNHTDKGSTSHAVDSEFEDPAKIYDISPQYQTKQENMFECEEIGSKYYPKGWELTGGASGSMLISKQNNKWVIVGIYWGGFNYTITGKTGVYFSPCWSVFNSEHKNFITPFI